MLLITALYLYEERLHLGMFVIESHAERMEQQTYKTRIRVCPAFQ